MGRESGKFVKQVCLHCRKLAAISMNGYCAGCVERASVRCVKLRGRQKCSVVGCENHTDQGEFVGSLCYPCHHFLSDETCTGIYSQAYRNERARFTSKLRQLAGDLAERFANMDVVVRPHGTIADQELARLARG